ncbi:MAG: replication factor C large subunit [Sulfolobales archaeon]
MALGSSNIPWIFKYRPRTLSDYIDQDEAKNKLIEWIKRFPNTEYKAVLLYGPPGTGKTTLVECLARDLGYEVVEMNASDFRRMQDIERIAIASADKAGLFGRRRLILLDEVDGINAKADLGGLEAVLRLIEVTRVPVIMTANDPWSPNLRPLRNVSLAIEVKKLSEGNVVKLLKKICLSEKIECDDEALKEIARRSEGDLRSAINDLESVARGVKKISLDYVREVLGYRDRERNPFETLGRIFSARSARAAKAAAGSSQLDNEMLMQWINENIPAQMQDPEDLWRAYEALSRADVYMGRIVKTGNWDLLSYAIDLMSAGVAMAKKSTERRWVSYRFPEKIRLMMRTKEARGVRDDIARLIASHDKISTSTAKNHVIPYLMIIFRNNPTEAAKIALGMKMSDTMIEYLAGPRAKEVISIVKELEKKIPSRESVEKKQVEAKTESKKPEQQPKTRKEEKPGKGVGLDRFIK